MAVAPSATSVADDRWLPWLGCWEPVAGAQLDRVCILPDEEGVRVQTVENDELTHTTRILADGVARPVEEAGCEGWERADWSADGRRVFLRSELNCEGGLDRASSGVLAILPDGVWLDIEVVHAGEQQATRVLRHRPVDPPAAVAADVAAALRPHEAGILGARREAGRRLSLDDVGEAVAATGPGTAAALVYERGEPFALDAAGLLSLAAAGVPGEVTDLMIALSFPDDFVIDRASGQAAARPAEAEQGPFMGDPYGRSFDRFGRRYSATARFGSCMLYDSFYARPFGRYGSGYGCPLFGYDAYYGIGGGWYGGSPIPVVGRVEPEPVQPPGRMVRGEGYTRTDGVSVPGRRARARSTSTDETTTSIGSTRSSTRTATSATSSSTGTGSRATSSTSSTSSSSGERRAVRRGSGGSEE